MVLRCRGKATVAAAIPFIAFICLGLLFLTIATAIIVSLIPIYLNKPTTAPKLSQSQLALITFYIDAVGDNTLPAGAILSADALQAIRARILLFLPANYISDVNVTRAETALVNSPGGTGSRRRR
ncbi:unnamed protein product, partial [Didymodactylos carnosus]